MDKTSLCGRSFCAPDFVRLCPADKISEKVVTLGKTLSVRDAHSLMNRFFDRLRSFMYGRNGPDALSYALLIAALLIAMLSVFIHFSYLSILSTLLIVLAIWRQFSRNIARRQVENQKFLGFWRKISSWFSLQHRKFRERKTYRYLKCPACHVTVRVPRGRGKICITCPKCKIDFIRKV